MSRLKSFIKLIIDWIHYLYFFLKALFLEAEEKALIMAQFRELNEDIKLGKRKKSHVSNAFRQLSVIALLTLPTKQDLNIMAKPQTVLKWKKKFFKYVWTKKSRKIGRPTIDTNIIKEIRKIHNENPSYSPERIRDILNKSNIIDAPAPNTIAKYLPETRKPSSEKQKQSWLTFFKNHAHETWGMDFFTTLDIKFNVLYVFIIIHHETREIIHFGVTKNPTADWTVQQLRAATPYDEKPKYLIHDNDPIFRSAQVQNFLKSADIVSKRTAYRSPWQNPYAERVIGTIRRELIDLIIPINRKHVYNLLNEYINDYYNTYRPHQGLNGDTPIPSPEYPPTKMENTELKATPILNGLYHKYEKVA